MQKLKGVQLVIASGSETVQKCLKKLFAKYGADVVLCGFLNLKFVEQLEHNVMADVILIDMDDSYEEDDDALDLLLEKVDLPILFHDNAFDELNDPKDGECFSAPAVEKLAAKIIELVGDKVSHQETSDEVATNESQIDHTDELSESVSESSDSLNRQDFQTLEATPTVDVLEIDDEPAVADIEPSASIIDSSANKEPDTIPDVTNVWILGASIGGPEAVKRFLARLPKELPVAFVLAQHLGDGFVSLLANQLDRISNFYVKEAVSGDTLKHGEVVVVPVDNKMSLDKKGQIKFIEGDWKGHYKPSIDCVIDDVTSSFKKQSGVIIFSGMGADGVLASQQFADKYDGDIWAQSTDTCVISSMPDSVRKANLVSYSGSPEALALKIAVQYMGKDCYIV